MPQEKKPGSKDVKKYERLIRNFSSTSNSIAMYPPGHPLVEKQVKLLYEMMTEILKADGGVNIHYGEGILIINDASIPLTNKALEKIVEKFRDFKITDLEIASTITYQELKEFIELFIHTDETIQMYGNLNQACQKNQINAVRSLQAAYIRVSKNVKDKLGGQVIGELKISKEEMNRLISYLKGEIEISQSKELKSYDKIFKNPNLLVSLIDKIVIESKGLPEQDRKRMVIVILNQIGNYLSQESTNQSRQAQATKILTTLQKSLVTKSRSFIALGNDQDLKQQINQTVEQLKSIVKNHSLISQFGKETKKLEKLKEKIKTVAPQLLTIKTSQTEATIPQALLGEIKTFLEQIKSAEKLTENDHKKIDYFLKRL